MLSISISAQSLYFVRATVESSLLFDSPPPIQIIAYKPKMDSVLFFYKDFTKIIHTSKYSQLYDVAYYPRLGAFCFTNSEKKIYILNINQPDKLVELKAQCLVGYDLPSNLSVIKNYWVYECYNHEALQKKDVFLYQGIDSALNKKFDVLPSDFKDIYITGQNTQEVVLKPNDKHLYLPIVADTASRPTHSIELPQKYLVKKKKFLALVVNDGIQAMIAIRSENPKQGENCGRFYSIVYNKIDNQWFEVVLKGNALKLRAYGHWLAGSVRDGMDRNAKYFPLSKNSPGSAVRYSAKLPYQFADWAINTSIYAPGILYLLNTQTQKYIEWSTEQGDSEILLVQNEVVYYRVFDEIYKVTIENEEKLGKPELLVKENLVVPFIHWAFIGK